MKHAIENNRESNMTILILKEKIIAINKVNAELRRQPKSCHENICS